MDYEVNVFVFNKLRSSTTCSVHDAPRLFARAVKDIMGVREEHLAAKFESTKHFISFANPHVSVMMMGNITRDLLSMTIKETNYLLMD